MNKEGTPLKYGEYFEKVDYCLECLKSRHENVLRLEFTKSYVEFDWPFKWLYYILKFFKIGK